MTKTAYYTDFSHNDCLPTIDYPFYNESLIGYLFRLDFLNGYNPATIIKECIPEEIYKNINAFDLETIENTIDSKIVSKLTNISPNVIEKMKISNIRRKLFKYNCAYTKSTFKYGNLKICTECIKEWRIPQVFLFDNVRSCLLHGLELVSECCCKTKINLFNNERELFCQKENCLAKYSGLRYPTNIHPTTYDSEHISQCLFKMYLSEEISIVNKDEKIIKGILQRIEYLSKIKSVASQAILGTSYTNKNSSIIVTDYNTSLDNILRLSTIVAILNEFNISPFQFLNYHINDLSLPAKVSVDSIRVC